MPCATPKKKENFNYQKPDLSGEMIALHGGPFRVWNLSHALYGSKMSNFIHSAVNIPNHRDNDDLAAKVRRFLKMASPLIKTPIRPYYNISR